MKNKKAFQLSASFIVILIIVIVVFVGSVYFIKEFFFRAEELKIEIERSTKQQIESLLMEGSLVALPINVKETKMGKTETFGLGVRNIGQTKGFNVVISFSKAINNIGEVILDESYANYINENWLLYDSQGFFLDSNKLQVIPVAIRPDFNVAEGESTLEGTYLFNVCVFVDSGNIDPNKCNVDAFKFSEDKQEYYTKKIYSLRLEVK